VVVDDVEAHREAEAVRFIDETPQIFGRSVRRVRREERDAVVAPSALACERRDRHELDHRDAELREVRETRANGVERAFGRERADVELVDDVLRERSRDVRMLERATRDDARATVNAFRKRARVWIR
jgi:hypothetical protein